MAEEAKKREADAALEPLILSVRNKRVMLDADLARLYGVATMRFNEAFKRNQRRFPADFAFQLTAAEHANLRSQIAISSSQSIDSAGESTHGGRRHLPWAFTAAPSAAARPTEEADRFPL
jgi:ORF6N domain-containing protein